MTVKLIKLPLKRLSWRILARTSGGKYLLLAKGNKRIAFNTLEKRVTHYYKV